MPTTDTTPPPELIRSLAETARAYPLREKIVVAPSYRVGGEWLDWTARCMCTPAGEPGGGAGGFINMRPVTPKRLLLDFAEEELRRRNLRLPGAEETLALAGKAFAAIKPASKAPSDTGYFTRLPASLPLVETLAKALDELEAAGFSSLNRAERHFASREKFDELSKLHRAYRRERTRAGIADRATLLDCALTALRHRISNSDSGSGNSNQSGDGKNHPLPLLLVPESITESADPEALALIEAWPRESLRVFPEDEGAPAAAVATRIADSTANEARQVFRTLFAKRIPLDTVEIIVTDTRTYIPAICDAAMEIFDCPAEELPLTFHAGIPAVHARPARLLAAWLAWLGDSLPPAGLANMLRDGLLGTGWQKTALGVPPEDLAARLLQLSIYGAPEEYRAALGKNRDRDNNSDAGDESAGEKQLCKAESWLARALPEILPLTNGGRALDLDNAPVVLRAANRLLKLADHTSSKLDAYANTALTEAIDAWLPYCDWPGFRPAAWLESLVSTLQIMGLGPQPGRAHVSDIHAGGFTGRPHTFVLGLDDARFPGGARQDPVLLDKERQRLSRTLPVAAHARERRENAMRRLLARLRGTVTLSHARHDAEADREQYPATLFTRFAEKTPAENAPPENTPPLQNDSANASANALHSAAVLRPDSAAEAATPRDALLWAVLSQPRNALTPADFAPWFPALAQGEVACAARAAGGVSIYSGNVPEAGADYSRAPWAISPTDMEVLAANPAEYFYKRVLKITPPDRFEPTPGKWLEGNERGNLLHDLFQDFVGELIANEDAVTPASFARHRERLLDMLDGAIAKFRRRKPVRDTLAYARERGEMIEACAIFLIAEIERNAEARPLRLEAALGGAKEDAPPWEQVDAIELPLPDGTTLPLKGRIDRIDRLHTEQSGGGGLVIWDYKTGRSDKFSAADPLQDGRHLQPLLYSLMLDHALRAKGLPEPIRRFSYFFPMPRDEGRTLSYAWSELVPAGLEIVMRLHAHLREGRYPLSPNQKDRAFSDYAPIFDYQ